MEEDFSEIARLKFGWWVIWNKRASSRYEMENRKRKKNQYTILIFVFGLECHAANEKQLQKVLVTKKTIANIQNMMITKSKQNEMQIRKNKSNFEFALLFFFYQMNTKKFCLFNEIRITDETPVQTNNNKIDEHPHRHHHGDEKVCAMLNN